MDRNTILGLVLIFLLLIGYSYFTKPSEEEMQATKHKQDSIQLVRAQEAIQQKMLEEKAENNQDVITEISNANDANKVAEFKEQFGSFGETSVGERKFFTIENDLIKVTISNQGGKVYSVQLKDYHTYDSLPLVLFDGDSTVFGLNFFSHNRAINTDVLFFTNNSDINEIVVNDKEETIEMRLYAGDNKYIAYVYSLEPDSYKLNFDMKFVGMNELIATTNSFITLKWDIFVPGQEKGKDWERTNSTIFYKYYQDEVDNLSERSDEAEEDIRTKIKWIGFKQQFFSSVLIADESFPNAFVKANSIEDESKYLKRFYAEMSVPVQNIPTENFGLSYYFGPNHYNTLKDYSENDPDENLQLERMIPLGWGFFLMHWINRFAVIPVFNFLEQYIGNYGIIILVLTILLKLFLFPFTYKSYLSTAKMRVLKPQIDEINKKIPKEKSVERQKATMALYKKVGVSPMGGCLPMVLQMPLLFAMFRFFPASIELRQKSFLWADDLSAFDSIYDLPFTIPAYGDHISLFCLLMGVTNLIYTHINNKQNPAQNQQMPGMKTMMYFMPVMFLVWFNNYASGLSYYYFIATLITILQTLLIRRFVNDDEILHKLETSKKKVVTKSKFQSRIEKMAKDKGYKQKK